ncbi:NAD-dependent epimerase/dehydratase family protein, partial [Streptomyces sp. NPDC001215]
MRVLVAGATGAVGSLLVPMLVAAGHEVTGTSRTLAAAIVPVVPRSFDRGVLCAVPRGPS